MSIKVNKNKAKKMDWVLIVVSLITLFLPEKFTFIILVLLNIYYIMKGRMILHVRINSVQSLYLYLILSGCIIGLINVLIGQNGFYDYIKHVYYTLTPLLFFNIGKKLALKEQNSEEILPNTLLMLGLVYAYYDLIRSGYLLSTNVGLSLYRLRNLIGTGTIFPILGLYCIIFYRRIFNKGIIYLSIPLFICSILIHFSRTSILELFILLLFSVTKRNIKKIIGIIAIITLFCLVISKYLPTYFEAFLDKIGNSFKEMSFNYSEWSYDEIVNNWRGFEAYSELNNFKLSNLLTKLIGKGYGSSLNVGPIASLVTDESTLPFFHNGFFTILMIWGIVGIIVYSLAFVFIFKAGEKIKCRRNRLFYYGISAIIFITTFFIHGVLFNPGIAYLVMLLAILRFSGTKQIKLEKYNLKETFT